MPELLHAPKAVKAELKRGLDWVAEGHGGDGLRDRTKAEARALLNDEPITRDKAVRMRAWLARHEVDQRAEGFRPGEPGYPSPGRVAWALWGGDPAIPWSDRVVNYFENEENMKKAYGYHGFHEAMEVSYKPPELPTPCTPADLTPAMAATMPPEMQAEFCARWNLVAAPMPAGLGIEHEAFGFVMAMLMQESGWTCRPDGSWVRVVSTVEGADETEDEMEMAKAGRVLSAANAERIRSAIGVLTELLAAAEPDTTEKGAPVQMQFTVVSKADEKMQAFGFAYVAKSATGETIVDHSGESIDPAELERAVYASIGKAIGRNNHDGGAVAMVIESVYLDHAKLEKMGAKPGNAPDGAWWVGFQVHDAEVWKAIKGGKSCLSIGGNARREAV